MLFRVLVALTIVVLLTPQANASSPKEPACTYELPYELQSWFQTFHDNLENNLINITDAQIEQVNQDYSEDYEERLRRGATLKNEPFAAVEPDDFRSAGVNFVNNYLESVIAACLKQVPEHMRHKVISRIKSRHAPVIYIEYHQHDIAALVMPQHGLMLSSIVIGATDENVAHVVTHELVHYLLEGADEGVAIGTNLLREGMTEYITLQTLESLDLCHAHKSYKDEVLCVSLLLIACGEDLLEWYFAGANDLAHNESFIHRCKEQLLALGIEQEQARTIMSLWREKDNARRALPSLKAEGKAKKRELTISMANLNHRYAEHTERKAKLIEDLQRWRTLLSLVEQEEFTVPVSLKKHKEFLNLKESESHSQSHVSKYAQEIQPVLIETMRGRPHWIDYGKTGKEKLLDAITDSQEFFRKESQKFKDESKRLADEAERFNQEATDWTIEHGEKLQEATDNLFYAHKVFLEAFSEASVDILSHLQGLNAPQYVQRKIKQKLGEMD